MNKQPILLEKIGQQIETAKYILERTYPLVKEEKLFVEVLGYLFAASSDLVYYSSQELKNKGIIPMIPQNSYERLRILSQYSKNTNMPEDISELYKRLKKLTSDYNSDLISFKRHQTYVICTKDYKVEVLSQTVLQKLLQKVVNLYMYHSTTPTNKGVLS